MLGAGDGFMAGLLKGWLDGEDWPASLRIANACGAFAVSRHGCTPAYPSLEELELFLARGVRERALRKDAELEQVHWATNRPLERPAMRVFAFDHRVQLEAMEGATPERIGRFKTLCLEAALRVADKRGGSAPGGDGGPGHGHGVLCDGRLGEEALYRAAGRGLWIGRPVEWPGSRPLTLEPALGPDAGALVEWPREHVVKCLCLAHPRRRRGDVGEPGGDRLAALSRRPAEPPRDAARGHHFEGGERERPGERPGGRGGRRHA